MFAKFDFLDRYGPSVLTGWFALGALLTLLGNAVSDVWLSSVAVIFLAFSVVNRNWEWATHFWVRAILFFWLWLLASAAISVWPGDALEEASVWVRFPVFAIGFAYFMQRYDSMRPWVIGSFVLGLVIMMCALGYEKWQFPDESRLYGTWSRDQKPKAGWFMLGMGLPICYWALGKIFESKKAVLWAIPLVLSILFFTILTGEIYISVSMMFGLVAYIILAGIVVGHSTGKMMAIMGATAGIGLWGLFKLLPGLGNHFTHSLLNRLPWLSSSDYYVPWTRGLEAGFLNPLRGVGAGNYEAFCKSNADLQAMSSWGCFNHPHQLYIQIFSETGVIGLALFAVFLIALFAYILRHRSLKSGSPDVVAALCLIVVVFWPLSTYSHAFGQHKNFFTWVSVGWALVFAHRAWRVSSAQRAD